MPIVRCGLDLSLLPVSQSGDGLRIVCVGRLSPEKGYFGLLEALGHLATRGIAFNLLVIGDGPSAGQILSSARQLGLDERIEFAGFLPEEETLRRIAGADIFVLPSLMEGLPVVLIEALALGKPVLASRVAGIPELLEEGQSGLMFTPSDWSDLAEKLERLLTDESLRRHLGGEGRKVVQAKFRIQDTAHRLRKLFLEEG
jgi:glycosyltransferase involved in cell wall biosynthesis